MKTELSIPDDKIAALTRTPWRNSLNDSIGCTGYCRIGFPGDLSFAETGLLMRNAEDV
jgi:hypothetical protein